MTGQGGISTTRKWIIPDAENDVGIRNVGNKGFPDAVNTASLFSRRTKKVSCVGNGVGKRGFSRRTIRRRENRLKSIGNAPYPDAFRGISRRRGTASGNLLFNRFSSVIYRTETERGIKRRSREGRRENRRSRSVFCRRRSPSSLAAVQPPSATLAIMSYRQSNFMETNDMFLQFEDDLDNNIAGGSSSVGDNTESSSQQATPTPRRRAQSRLLELERHVAINGRIPMTIAPGAEKPISPHVVRFSQAIGVCVRKTFPVRCLKFVEHQMLTTFKEFRADCHRHFKKYSDPEEARANPPNALEQSRTNKAARQKQPYNHSSGSKSFLQRQYELAERKGELVDRVELFRETHVRARTFVSQAAEDAHNQMLELQSQPTPEGSQPLSEDEICDQVLGRRPGYSKGLGWGPKPKARRTASASSSSTSCSQSTEKEIELQAKLQEALERIEVQDRNHQALALQVESMKKMIEELLVHNRDHHVIPSSTVHRHSLRRECLFPDAFLPTFFPTPFGMSGKVIPTYFSFSPTFFGVGSTRVSCSNRVLNIKD
ncbi:CACTA en-spm transposon protein [Cucumis melo var. makuwa]|uniref:CACTA en-spm transposon protein n=1 Tax=Cucumis melo var. makuwa TaxID=1194695 RepID=A0A5A7UU28_CUCMM|nr:CACTA en-spm transposon protein [Cucumis melo var. makuwa]